MAKRKKHPRLPNSFGSIRYISSGRRNPYAVHPPCKETDEFGRPIRPKALCYVDDWYVGFAVLTAYHAGTYKPGDELDLRTYRQQSEGRDLDVFCQKIIDNFAATRSAEVMLRKKLKSFEDVYRDYYKWKYELNAGGKSYSTSTLKATNAAFLNCKPLHGRAFSELRHADLQSCIDACPLKRASKELIVTLIKQMYRYAEMFEIVDRDYSKHISPNAPEDDEHGVAFTENELSVLWKHKEDPVISFVLVMCYSGFRIAAYKDIEINLEDRYFKGGVKTRASKDRVVPIHSAIFPLVNTLLQLNNGKIISGSIDRFREKMYQTLNTIGIEKHTPHDCRHTFSALCEKNGVRENDRKRMLGHSFSDITNNVYGHRELEDLREQIELIKI